MALLVFALYLACVLYIGRALLVYVTGDDPGQSLYGAAISFVAGGLLLAIVR
jgi:hypothetical protein